MKRITKKKINFNKLLSPHFNYNMSLDLEFIRYIIKKYEKNNDILAILSKKVCCKGFYSMDKISSDDLYNNSIKDDLQRRLSLLFFWEFEELKNDKINFNNSKIINNINAYDDTGSAKFNDILKKLFKDIAKKRILNKSPNEYHDARCIKEVRLGIRKDGYIIQIIYSLEFDDYYSWSLDFIKEEDEYLYEFIERVLNYIEDNSFKIHKKI